MPLYKRGDFVKVEFKDEGDELGEWMWVRVDRCDDINRIVFGTLDNEPILDYKGKLHRGAQLAVSFEKIREHLNPSEFSRKQ